MAERTLSNEATLAANYGGDNTPIALASNEVTTTLIDGLTFTKAADKQAWVNGTLTYTITINNTTGETLSNVVFTDALDTSLVNFNTSYGVQVDGTASTSFTYTSGTLTINLDNIATGTTKTITFQVTRI